MPTSVSSRSALYHNAFGSSRAVMWDRLATWRRLVIGAPFTPDSPSGQRWQAYPKAGRTHRSAAGPPASPYDAAPSHTRRPRHDQQGFALLLVFLMASIIAISLYMELPRIAFQSERQREQMLMERGEQYKRAIGLFLRTNKNTRWPANIDELESYNNHRSLRRRYLDPITGKDEWRLIHIQNGILTDSLTNKKPNSTTQASVSDGFIAEIQGIGAGAPSGTGSTNPGLRRRPSDGGPSVGPDGQPIQPDPSANNGVPPLPGSGPSGATGFTGGIGGLMGIPNPGGSVIPGAQGATGASGGVQINSSAQAAAAGLLQNLLTQPRPGGLAGLTGGVVPGQNGAIMGGGIAGVASKAEGDSIMVYGQKTDFSEWEFIYDPMKFSVPNPNGNGATGIGTPVAQIGSTAGMSNPGTPIGTGPGGTASPAGAPGGAPMGIAGSFGASPSGFGTPGASGASGATGATSAAAAGGTTFGQAGLPDIRPGKK